MLCAIDPVEGPRPAPDAALFNRSSMKRYTAPAGRLAGERLHLVETRWCAGALRRLGPGLRGERGDFAAMRQALVDQLGELGVLGDAIRSRKAAPLRATASKIPRTPAALSRSGASPWHARPRRADWPGSARRYVPLRRPHRLEDRRTKTEIGKHLGHIEIKERGMSIGHGRVPYVTAHCAAHNCLYEPGGDRRQGLLFCGAAKMANAAKLCTPPLRFRGLARRAIARCRASVDRASP